MVGYSGAIVARERKPLGALLVEAGLITPANLEEALAEHRRTGRRLGGVLTDMQLISAARLTQALSFQLSLPWVTLHQLTPSAELLEIVPGTIASRHRLIPVYVRRERGGRPSLYVATDDPTNGDGLSECARAAGMPVRPMVAGPEDLSRALQRHYGVTPTMLPPSAELPAPPPPASEPEEAAIELEPAPRSDSEIESPNSDSEIESPNSDSEIESPSSDSEIEPVEMVAGALRVHVAELPLPPGAEPPVLSESFPESLPGAAPAGAIPVLIVGARAEFVRRCREAAGERVAISIARLHDVHERARAKRPVALVVMEDLYAFDRVAFSRLAAEIGAQLVIWNDELDVDFLGPVLETAGRRT